MRKNKYFTFQNNLNKIIKHCLLDFCALGMQSNTLYFLGVINNFRTIFCSLLREWKLFTQQIFKGNTPSNQKQDGFLIEIIMWSEREEKPNIFRLMEEQHCKGFRQICIESLIHIRWIRLDLDGTGKKTTGFGRYNRI